MPLELEVRSDGLVGTGATVYGRVKSTSGSYVTQAALSSIAYSVTKLNSTDAATTGTLTISSVIYDTLQTSSDDANWTTDSTGFNFKYATPALWYASEGIYVAVFTFTPLVGEVFKASYKRVVRNPAE